MSAIIPAIVVIGESASDCSRELHSKEEMFFSDHAVKCTYNLIAPVALFHFINHVTFISVSFCILELYEMQFAFFLYGV